MDEYERRLWAEFRFGVIAPLVCRRMDDAQRRAKKQEILSTVHEWPNGEKGTVAERTLRTWLARHRLYGFDGLKQMKSRSSGTCRAISPELLEQAVELRRELRTRSIRTIISLLRVKGFDTDDISPSTLNFQLNQHGATKEKHASEKGSFQLFQKDHANELCQADSSGGIYLPDPDNKGQYRQTRLISFIDDATRVVLFAAFYWHEKVPDLLDAFRKALLRYGKMDQIYTDHGPCFKSKGFSSTCAQLGIELLHAEEYTPESKGKIERHIGTVKSGFYEEAKHSGLREIAELNKFFFAWLDTEYHRHKHKSLGMTPFERWQIDQDKGLITVVTPEEVRQALMIREQRKVNKRTALIQLNNRTYQTSSELAGKTVEVFWEPHRNNSPTIEVWYNGKHFDTAAEVVPGADIDYSKRPDRNRKPEPPKELESSKQYREAIVNAYHPAPEPLAESEFLSEPEFRLVVARLLEREFREEEIGYLSTAFERLSPLREDFTDTTLQKAISSKGLQMHLSYYCSALMRAKRKSV